MREFFKNLKEKIFGKRGLQRKPEPRPSSVVIKASAPKISEWVPSLSTRKDSYFIQIGFDFGTSYSKCICRDMIANKAWVHLHPGSDGHELPFLIPSTLLIKEGMLSHVEDPKRHYPENGLYHLKHVLVKVALGYFDDSALDPYRSAIGPCSTSQLSGFVEACAIYFLAGALGEVREEVKRRFPGFGMLPEDYMAVNLAIPVGHAEQPEVNKLYQRVICEAWNMADQMSGHPTIQLTELELLRKRNQAKLPRSLGEACLIYPEVSATVQGFVRSRVSSPGIYLFSDTGGGTVDQSVFIFIREDHGDLLTYLTGRVLPLGSSHIERRAAESCGRTDCLSLESWREKKEWGGADYELNKAKEWIAKELNRGTEGTLAFAKEKLFVKEQLNDIRVIFAGGGHCEHPYKNAVMCPFSGDQFRHPLAPDIVGLPFPRDLDPHETRWMRRLNVAYGLSFEKSELTRFTYPKDGRTPAPEEIWRPHKRLGHAPSKEEC